MMYKFFFTFYLKSNLTITYNMFYNSQYRVVNKDFENVPFFRVCHYIYIIIFLGILFLFFNKCCVLTK